MWLTRWLVASSAVHRKVTRRVAATKQTDSQPPPFTKRDSLNPVVILREKNGARLSSGPCENDCWRRVGRKPKVFGEPVPHWLPWRRTRRKRQPAAEACPAVVGIPEETTSSLFGVWSWGCASAVAPLAAGETRPCQRVALFVRLCDRRRHFSSGDISFFGLLYPPLCDV